MKYHIAPYALAAGIALSACSTSQISPAVDTFAKSVETANMTATKAFNADNLDANLEALRRQTLASQGSLYAQSGRCVPLNPLSVDIAQEPQAFNDHCALVAQSFDATNDEIIEVPLVLPDGDPAVQANNARRLLTALDAYAEALQELIKSDDPTKTGAAAASALAAIEGLSSSDDKKSDPPALLTTEGQALVSQATAEALERYRYKLLKETILRANPSVQDATRVIATWYYTSREEARIDAAYLALEDAVDAQELGNADDFLTVEKAYDAARKAEEEAVWRVFWQIASTHNAITESYETGSTETLLDANKRIAALAQTVRKFRDAN